MTRIAILDPFSGISGDMTLGALIDLGLDPEWLKALPGCLGLDGVTVSISDASRGSMACKKVDFDIPPQPHGRHLKHIREIINKSAEMPDDVRSLADEAFTAIVQVESEMHGVTPERVHLHEVGAVDAILDVVGSIWGFKLLGVERVYCGPISMGDGTVKAAHGVIPVPAPATLKLLQGFTVKPGPENSGELTTPTGAALVRVLSKGLPPAEYIPERSGFGAGTKDFEGRANALRVIIGEEVTAGAQNGNGMVEDLVLLATDIDDMTAEYLATAADKLRAAGALDVYILQTLMKKGRPGMRLEVLASAHRAQVLEDLIFAETTTLGVRRTHVKRRSLKRDMTTATLNGQEIRVKVATLPDGSTRSKPEHDDVTMVSQKT